MAAIEIEDLRVMYATRQGPVRAVDGLDLVVPEGGVFGFLGANGAGKTTAIRCTLGLLRGGSGSIRVLGETVPRRLNKVIDRVGALVEQPSFFPNFTGRKNLTLLARSRGFHRTRVDEVLETVGLTDRASSRYATYSLGMKQRLGVAAALLKAPQLLVLDEPSNGLDPPGIVEMRNLMRRLGAEGHTVFVSSHLLTEVQQMCDQVAIIASGRCVSMGTVHELLSGGHSRFRVRVPDDPARAGELLRAAGLVVNGTDGELVVDVNAEDAPRVTKVLADGGVYLSELSPIERTLEEVFIETTSRAQQ